MFPNLASSITKFSSFFLLGSCRHAQAIDAVAGQACRPTGMILRSYVEFKFTMIAMIFPTLKILSSNLCFGWY